MGLLGDGKLYLGHLGDWWEGLRIGGVVDASKNIGEEGVVRIEEGGVSDVVKVVGHLISLGCERQALSYILCLLL